MNQTKNIQCLGAAVLVASICLSLFQRGIHSNSIGDKTIFSNCQVTNESGPTNETIEILQIEHGMKLVEAETFYGAFYGLGFIHAMDRLWQIEFYRRLATGRLSELVGSQGLQIDKYLRTIGVPRWVEYQTSLLSAEDLLLYQNYAAGVNKVSENIQQYPPEFKILFHTNFVPFTIGDAISVQYLMVLFLSSDWFFELMRQQLAQIYTKEIVDQLMPVGSDKIYQFDNLESITDEELKKINMFEPYNDLLNAPNKLFYFENQQDNIFDGQQQEYLGNFDSNFKGEGSNCWAIHGSRTKSGKPLLACDPHLNKSVMSMWYVARLAWKKKDGRRVSFLNAQIVGSPLISHGKSDVASWGATSLNPDITDLYAEYVKDGKYLSDDGNSWEPIQETEEVIKVRWGKDVTLKVRFTRNGVIIPKSFVDGAASAMNVWISNDLFKNLSDNVEYAIAHIHEPRVQKQFGTQSSDFQLAEFYRLLVEHNHEPLKSKDLIDHVQTGVRIPFNFVFALQESGDIGYTIAGRHPIRKYKISQGGYTKIGHLNDNVWLGQVPTSEMPYVINPDKGFVVNANNFVSSHNVKHGISLSAVFPHRKVRITEMIENLEGKATVEDMKSIQLDVLDIQARASLADMLECARTGAGKQFKIQLGFDLFQGWDFQFGVESIPASLFEAWEYQIAKHMHEQKIQSQNVRMSMYGYGLYQGQLFKKIQQWAKDNQTVQPYCLVKDLNFENSCQQMMAYTLDQALQELERRLGPVDVKNGNWRYGNLMKCVYNHNPFSGIPMLRKIFEVETEYSGNRRTPSPAMYFYNSPEWKHYKFTTGSVFRFISDLSDSTQALIIMDLGLEQQSPWSVFRQSQNQLWQQGKYLTVDLVKTDQKQTAHTLRLEP